MRKILYIEDEHNLQKVFRDFLEKKHYKVISAFDGKTGIEIAKKERPDLILLDIILPHIDGIGVLKKLKENPKLRSIPVIVFTNLGSMENIERAIELGAKTYLIKEQYSLEEVEEKIKEVIDHNEN